MKDLEKLKNKLSSIDYCIGGLDSTFNSRDKDQYTKDAVYSITDYLRELTDAIIEIQNALNINK